MYIARTELISIFLLSLCRKNIPSSSIHLNLNQIFATIVEGRCLNCPLGKQLFCPFVRSISGIFELAWVCVGLNRQVGLCIYLYFTK